MISIQDDSGIVDHLDKLPVIELHPLPKLGLLDLYLTSVQWVVTIYTGSQTRHDGNEGSTNDVFRVINVEAAFLRLRVRLPMDDKADKAEDRLIGFLKSMDSAKSFGKAWQCLADHMAVHRRAHLHLGGVRERQYPIRLLQHLSEE